MLKRKYDNLKKRTKEKHAEEKLSTTTSLEASEITCLLNILEEFSGALQNSNNSNEMYLIAKVIRIIRTNYFMATIDLFRFLTLSKIIYGGILKNASITNMTGHSVVIPS